MEDNLYDLRKSYEKAALEIDAVDQDPLMQFTLWFEEAKAEETVEEANAMTLTTLGIDGFPKGRVVLLKKYNRDGFFFYTNYLSEKGKAITVNNKVSLSFFWPNLERQLIIKGIAERTSEEDSTAYFQSRPKGSQLGALVSEQSEEIEDRNLLEERLKALELEYADREVPKPVHWGGYVVKPVSYEFWQGRKNRLHDRILYEFADHTWNIKRLQP